MFEVAGLHGTRGIIQRRGKQRVENEKSKRRPGAPFISFPSFARCQRVALFIGELTGSDRCVCEREREREREREKEKERESSHRKPSLLHSTGDRDFSLTHSKRARLKERKNKLSGHHICSMCKAAMFKSPNSFLDFHPPEAASIIPA